MKNMLRSVLTAGVFALCTVAGLMAAKAEVLRIAVVVADNAADYTNNAALAPTFAALLKKGTGVKGVYVGTDAAKMSIASSSVWDSEANAKAATSTDEWKAAVGKLKFKTYRAEFLEVK
jgi:hypothetical protein